MAAVAGYNPATYRQHAPAALPMKIHPKPLPGPPPGPPPAPTPQFRLNVIEHELYPPRLQDQRGMSEIKNEEPVPQLPPRPQSAAPAYQDTTYYPPPPTKPARHRPSPGISPGQQPHVTSPPLSPPQYQNTSPCSPEIDHSRRYSSPIIHAPQPHPFQPPHASNNHTPASISPQSIHTPLTPGQMPFQQPNHGYFGPAPHYAPPPGQAGPAQYHPNLVTNAQDQKWAGPQPPQQGMPFHAAPNPHMRRASYAHPGQHPPPYFTNPSPGSSPRPQHLHPSLGHAAQPNGQYFVPAQNVQGPGVHLQPPGSRPPPANGTKALRQTKSTGTLSKLYHNRKVRKAAMWGVRLGVIGLLGADIGDCDFGDGGGDISGGDDFSGGDVSTGDDGGAGFSDGDVGAGGGGVDYGATDYGATDYGATDYGATDYGSADYGATDYGSTDYAQDGTYGGYDDSGQQGQYGDAMAGGSDATTQAVNTQAQQLMQVQAANAAYQPLNTMASMPAI